jgi:3-hydroxyacyl-[acyl-carrier-protein] dehydratase
MSEAQPQPTGRIDRIDIHDIMKGLPHRFPFLLVDRILDFIPDKEAVGIKNVSVNEPFFQGHFPDNYVMPGVLVIEAMCQTAGAVVVHTMGMAAAHGFSVLFMSIEGAKFRRPVIPGDQLRMHVVKERRHGPVWRFSGVCTVDGVKVAEATFTAMVVRKQQQAPAGS